MNTEQKMKVNTRLITRVSPQIGKNELLLVLILFDLCKKEKCLINKEKLHNHVLMTNSLKERLNLVIKNITTTKLMCDKYTTNPEPNCVIFDSIVKEYDNYLVTVNKDTFETLRLGWYVFINEIDVLVMSCHELRFYLWVKTWTQNKKRTIDINVIKTYFGVITLKTNKFIYNYIGSFLEKLASIGINIKMEKVKKENNKRCIKEIMFEID